MANTAASILITACLDNIARATSATTVSGAAMSAIALRWLNHTMSAINMQHNFTDLYVTGAPTPAATVIGTKTYAFPTDWWEIFAVILVDGTNSRKLNLVMPRRTLRDNPYPESDSQDVPINYMPYGDNFDLSPIPNAVYTMAIRYSKLPTVITNSATLIDYSPDKDELIIAGMTSRAHLYLQQYEDAAAWSNVFKGLLKDAIDCDMYPTDWEPKGEGFGYRRLISGQYWNQPLIRGVY